VADLLRELDRNELFDPRDFKSGDSALFQSAGDFLPQGTGEVEIAVIGDAGGAEEEFNDLGGPVEIPERIECPHDELGRDDGLSAGVERGAIEE